MQGVKYTTLIIIAALFTACGGNTYYLTTDNARGLEAGDEVYRQGIVVGEVEDVRFVADEVQIEVFLEEEMYEGQSFSIQKGPYGPELELDRPAGGANALASGATVSKWGDRGGLFSSLEGLGRIIEDAVEDVIGSDGRKLERSLEELEEQLEAKAEELEAVADSWEGRIENADSHGEHEFDELERKLQAWSREQEEEVLAFSEQLDAWAEEYDGDLEDIARVLQQAAERYELGSGEWKKAVREGLKE